VRGEEVGSGERRVRQLFAEAKRCAPSIIFIDEFQPVFSTRDEGSGGSADEQVGATLSATLSGCFDDLTTWNRYSGPESLVTVIASTNEPWAVDRSFLRPQRLERCLFVGPLTNAGRLEFFAIHASWHGLTHPQLEMLAAQTEGFTGADLTLLFSRARDFLDSEVGSHSSQVEDDGGEILPGYFSDALELTNPSVTVEEVEEYMQWQQRHLHLMTTEQL